MHSALALVSVSFLFYTLDSDSDSDSILDSESESDSDSDSKSDSVLDSDSDLDLDLDSDSDSATTTSISTSFVIAGFLRLSPGKCKWCIWKEKIGCDGGKDSQDKRVENNVADNENNWGDGNFLKKNVDTMLETRKKKNKVDI